MSVMEEKHFSLIAQHQNLNSDSVQGIFKFLYVFCFKIFVYFPLTSIAYQT